MAKAPPADDPRFEYGRQRINETKGEISTYTLQGEAKKKFGKYLSKEQVERLRIECGFPPKGPTDRRRVEAEVKKNGVQQTAPGTASEVLDTCIRQAGTKLQKIAQRFQLASITLTYREGEGTSWTFRAPAPEQSGSL